MRGHTSPEGLAREVSRWPSAQARRVFSEARKRELARKQGEKTAALVAFTEAYIELRRHRCMGCSGKGRVTVVSRQECSCCYGRGYAEVMA